MMAERWSDAGRDLASAKRHFASAVRIYRNSPGTVETEAGYDAAMALQHAMLAGYTSFETATRRILALIGEETPVGPDWHATLPGRISHAIEDRRPAILSSEASKAVAELMRFRHVAMHAYDSFDFGRANPAVEAAEVFLARIDDEIAAFRAVIGPD